MNICVYGASSSDIDKTYIEGGEKMGAAIARADAAVVFGGGASGLMGAVARGAKSAGGRVIGIAPSFFNVDGVLFPDCDEFIYTETMSERKSLLIEKSDAILVTPGGLGTFDEFFEAVTLRQLSIHKKPIALFNINGYFDPLNAVLENAIKGDFMSEKNRELYFISESAEEIIKYFKNYSPSIGGIYDYKNFKLK